MKSSVRNENKIRVSSIYTSVCAKADDISIETNAGARQLLQTNSPGNWVETEKIAAGSNLLHPLRGKADCFEMF